MHEHCTYIIYSWLMRFSKKITVIKKVHYIVHVSQIEKKTTEEVAARKVK